MKKHALTVIPLALALTIAGCDRGVEKSDYNDSLKLSGDLKDCKAYKVKGSVNAITVIRCPNSTTTTQTEGKNPVTIAVIDGEKTSNTPENSRLKTK